MLHKILKSEYLRNASTLMSGTVLSQLIPIALSPVISRLYIPEDYAILAAYSSLTIILEIISTGMYSHALMLDETDEKAVNTGIVALLFTTIIAIISLLLVLIFQDFLAEYTGNQYLKHWLYLIPLTVVFTGGYETLNIWNNRKKRYRRLATNRIIRSSIVVFFTIVLGFTGQSSYGLLISLLIGQAISFGLLAFQTYINDNLLSKNINLKCIISSFKKHKDFPLYNMPQGFLDGIRRSSIIAIISNYYGVIALGSYSFAENITAKPLGFISGSFSQVYYQKASEKYKNGENIWKITKRTILIIAGFGIPFSILLILWGSDFFSYVFGNNWIQAGRIASILTLYLLFKTIVSSISGLPLILNQQKMNLLFSIFGNLLSPLILLMSSLYLSFEFSLLIFVFYNLIYFAIFLIWIYKISNK